MNIKRKLSKALIIAGLIVYGQFSVCSRPAASATAASEPVTSANPAEEQHLIIEGRGKITLAQAKDLLTKGEPLTTANRSSKVIQI